MKFNKQNVFKYVIYISASKAYFSVSFRNILYHYKCHNVPTLKPTHITTPVPNLYLTIQHEHNIPCNVRRLGC